MKDVRIKNGNLQVRTHSYFNPFTEKYFHLIGVCHLASADFWAETQREIADMEAVYEGAQVHYEGVLHDVEKDIAVISSLHHTRFGRTIQLPYQRDGLQYEPHWIRTDMTLSQILAKMKDPAKFVRSLHSMSDSVAEAADLLEESKWAVPVYRMVLRYGIALARLVKHPEYSVLIDLRNRYAVSTMLTSGTDIITLWGAEHLKGMRNILEASGYELIQSRWNTCVPRKI